MRYQVTYSKKRRKYFLDFFFSWKDSCRSFYFNNKSLWCRKFN